MASGLDLNDVILFAPFGVEITPAAVLDGSLTAIDPSAGPGGAVPEPITATLSLLGLGVLGMATRRRVG